MTLTYFTARSILEKYALRSVKIFFVVGLYRATDEGSLPEIAQYSPYYLPLNVFTASKGMNLYFYLLLLQLVLCRVAALKSLPVHHP